MLIGFDEIQRRAIKFVKDGEDASDERAEAPRLSRPLFNRLTLLRRQSDAPVTARDQLLPRLMSGEVAV